MKNRRSLVLIGCTLFLQTVMFFQGVMFSETVFAANSSYAGNQQNISSRVKANNTQLKALSARQVQPKMQLANIKVFKKVDMVRLKPITPSNKKPEGPDPDKFISLRNIIDEGLLLKDIEKIAGWDGDMLFQDKAVGNLFYYVPKTFLLKHSPSGYAFGVQYNKQAEAGKPSVTLSMELSAQGKRGDIALLKQILHEALDLKVSEKIKLQSLSGSDIQVDFNSLSTGLAISQDRIHVTPPKNLHDSLHITFSLTQDETESVFSLIAHEGMVGTLSLPIASVTDENSKGTKSNISIPFKIKYSEFNGAAIGGFEEWWVDKQQIKKLTNNSAYPISVKGINGYVVQGNKLKRVTKSFKKGVSFKPGASKKIKLPAVQKALGNNVLVAWLDTDIDTDCSKCVKNIKAQIDRGVSDNPTTDISFEAIPSVFEDMEIYKVILRVKSPYYSVDRNKVEERTIQLTEEDNVANLSIYYPEKKGKSPLLFRYQIKVVFSSGEQVSSDTWVDSRDLTKIIGSSQLESLLGEEEFGEEEVGEESDEDDLENAEQEEEE